MLCHDCPWCRKLLICMWRLHCVKWFCVSAEKKNKNIISFYIVFTGGECPSCDTISSHGDLQLCLSRHVQLYDRYRNCCAMQTTLVAFLLICCSLEISDVMESSKIAHTLVDLWTEFTKMYKKFSSAMKKNFFLAIF